jgi:hypothetical protein
VLEAEYVVIAEVPHMRDDGHAQDILLPTFVSAVKAYHLHVQRGEKGSDNAFVSAEMLTHYADTPFEALYSGFFLEEAAMRTYVSMYDVGQPYAQEVKVLNEQLLAGKVSESFKAGESEAY